MNKIIQKHLFFLTKNYNWQNMPEDRKYKVVFQYVMGIDKQANKRQDLARLIYNKKLNHLELLELAVGITIN